MPPIMEDSRPSCDQMMCRENMNNRESIAHPSSDYKFRVGFRAVLSAVVY